MIRSKLLSIAKDLRLYKIEAGSEGNAHKVDTYIKCVGGKCLQRGSAIITDYVFKEEDHLIFSLMGTPKDYECLSDSDIQMFINIK